MGPVELLVWFLSSENLQGVTHNPIPYDLHPLVQSQSKGITIVQVLSK